MNLKQYEKVANEKRRIKLKLLVDGTEGTQGEIAERLGIKRQSLVRKLNGSRATTSDFLECATMELAND